MLYNRIFLFKLISDGEFFKEGDSSININFGEEAQQLRQLVADFNSKETDWFLSIDLEETNLSKWWFKFKPLTEEAFRFYRKKKYEKLIPIYGNTTYAMRASHILYSFESKVIEAVKELRILSKCTKAPVIDPDDLLTSNTNMVKWCDGVSPAFLELTTPRKISVVDILYGKYLNDEPLEIKTTYKLSSVL